MAKLVVVKENGYFREKVVKTSNEVKTIRKKKLSKEEILELAKQE